MGAEPTNPPATGSAQRTALEPAGATPALDGDHRSPVEIAAEVATVLAGMSYEERVRAYRSGALSAHELALAAGWFGEELPLLNGEYEWIAIDAE